MGIVYDSQGRPVYESAYDRVNKKYGNGYRNPTAADRIQTKYGGPAASPSPTKPSSPSPQLARPSTGRLPQPQISPEAKSMSDWASQWGASQPKPSPWASWESDAQAEALSEIESMMAALFPTPSKNTGGGGSSGATAQALRQLMGDNKWREPYAQMRTDTNNAYGQMADNLRVSQSNQTAAINNAFGQMNTQLGAGFDQAAALGQQRYDQALGQLAEALGAATGQVNSGYDNLDQSLLQLLSNPYANAPRAAGIQADPMLEQLLNSQGVNPGEYQLANRMGQQQSVDAARQFNNMLELMGMTQDASNQGRRADSAQGRAAALGALQQMNASQRGSLTQQNLQAQQDLALRRLEAQTGLSRDQLTAILGVDQQFEQGMTSMLNDQLKAILGIGSSEVQQGADNRQALLDYALKAGVPIGGLL